MARQLLIDSFGLKLNHLTEEQGAGPYAFTGKFAQADTPTSNRRIYPRPLWERELAKLAPKIEQGKVYGELDHPDDGKTKLQRAAVLITSLKIDENGQVIGGLKVLDTSMGKELKAIVDGGGAIGISSRGYGSVKMTEDGDSLVQDDFVLMTFDPVADPAEESAYLETANAVEKQPMASMTSESKSRKSRREEEAPKVVVEPKDSEEIEADEPKAEEPQKLEPAPQELEAPTPPNITAPVLAPLPTIEPEGDVDADEVEEEEGDEDDKEKEKDEDEKEAEILKSNKAIKAVESRLRKTFEAKLLVALKEAKQKVRAEVMSEMMSDPAVAGAKEAMEKVRAVMRPYVLSEDVEKVVGEKEKEIKALKEQVAALQKNVKSISVNLHSMTEAAKEMGFNLYMERNLVGLSTSQKRRVASQLGDLSKIPTLEALKKRLAAPLQESRTRIETNNKEVRLLKEQLAFQAEEAEVLREELEEALHLGLENAARVYLERKIVGNPHQSEIRDRFEGMDRKTKESVDKLVEHYRTIRIQENSDFSRVRARLQQAKGSYKSSLVEDRVKETFPEKSGKTVEVGGHSFNMAELNKLAGVR